MLKKFITLLIAVSFAISNVAISFAQEQTSEPLFEYSEINHPVIGKKGMVASHNILSSQIDLYCHPFLIFAKK